MYYCDSPPLIIDIGTGFMKADLANEQLPAVTARRSGIDDVLMQQFCFSKENKDSELAERRKSAMSVYSLKQVQYCTYRSRPHTLEKV